MLLEFLFQSQVEIIPTTKTIIIEHHCNGISAQRAGIEVCDLHHKIEWFYLRHKIFCIYNFWTAAVHRDLIESFCLYFTFIGYKLRTQPEFRHQKKTSSSNNRQRFAVLKPNVSMWPNIYKDRDFDNDSVFHFESDFAYFQIKSFLNWLNWVLRFRGGLKNKNLRMLKYYFQLRLIAFHANTKRLLTKPKTKLLCILIFLSHFCNSKERNNISFCTPEAECKREFKYSCFCSGNS